MTKLEEILTKIARRNLGIETLETRKANFLNFHDGICVWQLKKALEEAYKEGQKSMMSSQRYLKKETQKP